MIRTLVLVAALGLAACAPAPIVTLTAWGPVIEFPGVECPDGQPSGGCTMRPAAVVFYPEGDMRARRHEFEHVAGMKHRLWEMRNDLMCAQVTARGDTLWFPGDWICRLPNGEYVRGEP